MHADQLSSFGSRFVWWVALMMAAVACPAIAQAPPETPAVSEGQHTRTLTLNGTWEYAVGEGTDQTERPECQTGLIWQAVQLPGPFMPWSEKAVSDIAFVWARRYDLVAERILVNICSGSPAGETNRSIP